MRVRRPYLIGAALMLSGAALLLASLAYQMRYATALPPMPLSQSFAFDEPLEYCEACHLSAPEMPRISAALITDVQRLEQKIIAFNIATPYTLKQDVRYQQALDSFWQLQTSSEIANPQANQDLSRKIDSLLRVLENEATSGYWQAPQGREPNLAAVLMPPTIPNPAAMDNTAQSLSLIAWPAATNALSWGLAAAFIFVLAYSVVFARRRNGPPSDEAAHVLGFWLTLRGCSRLAEQPLFIFSLGLAAFSFWPSAQNGLVGNEFKSF